MSAKNKPVVKPAVTPEAPAVLDKATADETVTGNDTATVGDEAKGAADAEKQEATATGEEHGDEKAVSVEDIVVPVAVVQIDKNAPDSTASSFNEESSYVSFIKSLSTHGQGLVARLEDYIVAVKPGMPIEIPDLLRQQKALYRIVMAFVENPEPTFAGPWNALLYLFNKHASGALGGHHPFRMLEQLDITPEEFATIQRIINLLQLTCNVQSRDVAMRQVSLDKTLSYPVSAQARRNIITFYQQ